MLISVSNSSRIHLLSTPSLFSKTLFSSRRNGVFLRRQLSQQHLLSSPLRQEQCRNYKISRISYGGSKVDLNVLKDLRFKTEAPIKDCGEALLASENDINKALMWLKNKGLSKAVGKRERVTDYGVMVASFIHYVGAFAFKICCETDFSAGNSRFLATANEVGRIAQRFIRDNSKLVTDLNYSGDNYKDSKSEEISKEITAAVSKLSQEVLNSCVHALGENVAIKSTTILPQPTNLSPELLSAPTLYGCYAHSTATSKIESDHNEEFTKHNNSDEKSSILNPSFVGKTVGLASVRVLNNNLVIPGIVDDLAQHCVANFGVDESEDIINHQNFRGSSMTVNKFLKNHGCKFSSSMVIEFGKEPIVRLAKSPIIPEKRS